MKKVFLTIFSFSLIFPLTSYWAGQEKEARAQMQTNTSQSSRIKIFNAGKGSYEEVEKVIKTDEEWKKILTPEEFKVTRKQGTERAFSGRDWDNHKHGIYKCIGCGTELFLSETKFESGTGWPSFFKPVAPENVDLREDNAFFMKRTEVRCPRCGAHLGHVFDDGPAPTHKRFCMNSAALKFEEKQ